MAFEDFAQFDNPIILTYRGKEYRVPEVSVRMGALLTLNTEYGQEVVRIQQENREAAEKAIAAGEAIPEPVPLPEKPPELTSEDGLSIELMLLGDVYQQMVDDDVPYKVIQAAGVTAAHDFYYGREVAEAFWNSGGDPKAAGDAMADQIGSMRSTVEESTTQKPDSTSGTKPRKKK